MASLTASNGEGSGIIVPGTGIILNNMLGEEDLNPDGFHRWPTNKRLSSMMAPSIFENEKVALVLGSAGSNRIRSAILQTIIRVVNYKLDLETAVNDSRLHFENGKLDLEEGFSKEEVKKIKTSNLVDTVNLWKEKSLFFGGANCLFYNKEKQNLTAVGDIRRDGKGVVRNF
jgi:gamma-glutamyltranspeptidase/glutathione hydrolase